jgi:hypothetical protein
MKVALTVALAIVVAVSTTILLPVNSDRLLYGGALALGAVIVFSSRKFWQPWWSPAPSFSLMGTCHLIALWLFPSKAYSSGAGPAFETLGPGYILMAAYFYISRRQLAEKRPV